ncbi:DUF4351 domain-containing protein [Ancylothrix sp. C2]|uniref:DUF4351 domain-containing protein n=1 Tax=Ancylothrix sp. D3o TaxID=2953691 RepID=UPI0021BB3382|nr:DUF4351 domain-containing protein [Ancylothrix sp. D3o]MCT7951573.1 DUF4351 domain-containing protein [Ancylothrix sp. D3o]
MFRYFARLTEKYRLPVYPIAVLSFNSPRTVQPKVYQVAFPNKVVLQFDYDVIQLNRLNWRDFLRQQNPVASALMAKMNIEPSDRLQVKLECLRLLATLRLDPARMTLISGFIDTYLRLSAEEESRLESEIATMEPVQQEVVMEIVTSWMERGIEQGLQQGKQSQTLALIFRQLPRRIGAINPELERHIRSLAVPQLEELAEALLDFSNEADLVNWLQQISEEAPAE